MKTRVYVVEQAAANGENREHLVQATYGHTAERFIIGQLVAARIATKSDLVRLLSAGVRVQVAEEPEEPGKAADDATFASLPPIG